MKKYNRFIITLLLSILSFAISFLTFLYTIYKDNKESISLWCLEYDYYSDNGNGYLISGTYIVTNNSHKSVSIVDAYVIYEGRKMPSNLDTNDTFPISLDANTSCKIVVEPKFKYASNLLDPSLFGIEVISSKQKHYSLKSSVN